MKITLEHIEGRAESARRALVAAQGRLANEAQPSYESVTRLVDAAADARVWGTLEYLAANRRGQGDHVDDTDEQVIAWLAEQITYRVFGFFGNRSTNVQSNEAEYAEHVAWITAGRDNFRLGRGW